MIVGRTGKGNAMRAKRYAVAIEGRMKALYRSLNERDRRRYAAIEAAKLGYGGRKYVADLLGVDYATLRRGLRDLDDPPDLPPGRIRKKGGT